MKTQKYYLILCLITAVLCTSAFSQAKSTLPGSKPVSLGRANPALVGIDRLYINIVSSSTGFDEAGQFPQKLRAEIEKKIARTGIRIYSGPVLADSPQEKNAVLVVNIDMLGLGDSRQNIFLVRTLLSKDIYLPQAPLLRLKVEVWTRGETVEPTSAKNTPAAVTELALKQVEAFVSDYLSANPQSDRSSDSKTSGNVPAATAKESSRAPAKSPATEYKFVASKNSRVFHKPQCSSAKRIISRNLVVYSSRVEAIKSGKRACKRCEP
ncbi:MAG: Ada metal-binding domain-containing protein [Planctomycetota bacterium]|jgi:hypothetical protein